MKRLSVFFFIFIFFNFTFFCFSMNVATNSSQPVQSSQLAEDEYFRNKKWRDGPEAGTDENLIFNRAIWRVQTAVMRRKLGLIRSKRFEFNEVEGAVLDLERFSNTLNGGCGYPKLTQGLREAFQEFLPDFDKYKKKDFRETYFFDANLIGTKAVNCAERDMALFIYNLGGVSLEYEYRASESVVYLRSGRIDVKDKSEGQSWENKLAKSLKLYREILSISHIQEQYPVITEEGNRQNEKCLSNFAEIFRLGILFPDFAYEAESENGNLDTLCRVFCDQIWPSEQYMHKDYLKFVLILRQVLNYHFMRGFVERPSFSPEELYLTHLSQLMILIDIMAISDQQKLSDFLFFCAGCSGLIKADPFDHPDREGVNVPLCYVLAKAAFTLYDGHKLLSPYRLYAYSRFFWFSSIFSSEPYVNIRDYDTLDRKKATENIYATHIRYYLEFMKKNRKNYTSNKNRLEGIFERYLDFVVNKNLLQELFEEYVGLLSLHDPSDRDYLKENSPLGRKVTRLLAAS